MGKTSRNLEEPQIMSAFDSLGNKGELACTFATLVLHDEGQAIAADGISKLLKAANVSVEGYWPTLFANALSDANVGDILMSGGGGSGVSAPAPTGGNAGAPAEEEEEDMDLGDLFG